MNDISIGWKPASKSPSLNVAAIVALSILTFALCRIVTVVGQPLTDPVGDVFDGRGKPVVAEPYLDVIRSDASLSNGNLTVKIQVNGPLPKEPVMPKNIDNPSGRPLTISWEVQIGVFTARDLKIALELADWGYHITMIDYLVESWTWDPKGIYFSIEGDIICLLISPNLIGNPESFRYKIFVFEYLQPICLENLLACDVAPNEGYYIFPDHHLQVEPGFPTASFETEHATVYYNIGDDARAKNVAEGFEYAYSHIAEDFTAQLTKKFTLYVYVTQDDLVEGLIKYSHLPSEVAELFRGSGAPRPIDYVMHIAPDFDWRTIAHELTHTFIEEHSGRVFLSIKWLDEGLADYEAYNWVSKTKYNATASKWKASRMQVVYKAFEEKKLFPLKDISTDQSWGDNMAKGYADLEYSQAYLTVTYLCETYGLDKCKAILRSMQEGATQEEAVKSTIGITMAQLEDRFKDYLQRTLTETETKTLPQSPMSWLQTNWQYIIVGGLLVLVVCTAAIATRMRRVKAQNRRKQSNGARRTMHDMLAAWPFHS